MPRDDRVAAIQAHLAFERAAGRSVLSCTDEWLTRLISAADQLDPLRHPAPELKGKPHLILYFATPQDASEFADVVRSAFGRMVEIRL